MSEVIQLSGIEEYGRHGVYDSEKQNKQKFVVDIQLELNRSELTDSIRSTVDYAELVCKVREVIAANQFELIETLANAIAEKCLADSLVIGVEVVIYKPEAAKSLGVSSVSVVVNKQR